MPAESEIRKAQGTGRVKQDAQRQDLLARVAKFADSIKAKKRECICFDVFGCEGKMIERGNR
jgi:hypothetical protein